jgi:ATP-dependent Clp protease adaptor protein ClpS
MGTAQDTLAPPRQEPRSAGSKPKRQPPYNVILHDDDEHTYGYVVRMLGELFGLGVTRAFRLAREVDKTGRAIVATTTLERAELKRDQIHAYGKDILATRPGGSMRASIQPVPE